MTTRQKNAIVLIAAIAAAVFGLFALEKNRAKTGDGAVHLLDAIPADTFLLATVDVAKVRHSPLAEPLRAFGASMGKGLLGQQCGFDPVERLDALAVAIPEAEGTSDFGIATAGPITKEELVPCAQKVMLSHGAHFGTRDVAGFTLLEDKGTFAAAQAKLAVRDRGPFLLARDPWLTSMIDAWERRRPRIETNPKHTELRRRLSASKMPASRSRCPVR